MSLLEVRDIYGGYGGVDILNGASLTTDGDEIVVIIGPNGAGKSTLMKAVFGLVKVRAGDIFFEGQSVTGLRPDQIVRRGLSYVPQENNVFPSMTVEENLEMGAYLRDDDFSGQMARIYEYFPRLKERRRQFAGSMSGGERQMLAIGRALMLEPKLLMLDEPTAGLSPKFADQTLEQIKTIRELGVGILLVEQNAKQALAIADRGCVLVMGKDRYVDTARGLLDNREVAEMFLGG